MRSFVASVAACVLVACGGKSQPAEPPPEPNRMEHCGWYTRAVDDYGRREAAPPADRDAARDELAVTHAGLDRYESMTEDERAAADDACWQAYGDVITRMKASSCELPPGAD